MDVVLKLRELRRLRGLSQKDASDRTGIGEKSISSFETGERISSMKLSQLERLLHAYGVTMKEFFSDRIDKKIAPWDTSREDEEIEGILADLRMLPRKSRAGLLSRVRMMIDSATEMPAVSHTAHARPIAHSREVQHDWELMNSRN